MPTTDLRVAAQREEQHARITVDAGKWAEAADISMMVDLAVAAARYRLGLQSGEALRDLGEALLAEGRDEAVRLAIVDDLAMADVGLVFEQVCAALGQSIPSLDEAIEIVTAALLADIASGAAEPEAGLQRLMNDIVRPYVNAETAAGTHEYVGQSRDLQHLIGAYWSYAELRSRPNELSIDGRFGPDAVPLLDAQAIGFARDWIREHAER